MPTLLIGCNEPKSRKKVFHDAIDSPLPELRGCDVLAFLPGPPSIRVGFQIKRVPDDFCSSLEDGRLQRELALMKGNVDIGVLIPEGRFRFNDCGRLKGRGKGSPPYRLTSVAVRNLLRSIQFQFGVVIEHSHSQEGTRQTVLEVIDYLSRSHVGLFRRPNFSGIWGSKVSEDELALWILQGFAGIGVGLARRIMARFGGIPLSFTCTAEELGEVEGISKTRARQMVEFLKERRSGSA